jgi:hypothetical protein
MPLRLKPKQEYFAKHPLTCSCVKLNVSRASMTDGTEIS